MINCPVCKSKVKLSKFSCEQCGLVMEGNFTMPRLARLEGQYLALAEQMILSGGNLKDLAQAVGVSYPTIRRKVDELVAALKKIKEEDEGRISSILGDIDKGTIKAEEGIRKIKELQGEI